MEENTQTVVKKKSQVKKKKPTKKNVVKSSDSNQATTSTNSTKSSVSRSTNNSSTNANAVLDAINRSQAIIEFEVNGTIITANKNFLDTVGYSLEQIVGNHHRIFCEPQYANSPEYAEFWNQLRNGVFITGEFRRLNRTGNEIYLQASYNPVSDQNGKIIKIVKIASNITGKKLQEKAVASSQAIVEFDVNGKCLTANENFLNAMGGYTLSEIVGQHHRIFCEPEFVNSPSYGQLWAQLNRGESFSGELKRVRKDKSIIYLRGTYSPTYDNNGKIIKVIKYANDITDSVKAREQASILKSSVVGSATAMVTCDRNLIITYANPATINLIEKNIEVFQKHFPDLTKDNLVGSCIDIFHKKASYQRKILSNPENLPHKATISVPPLSFELNVSAMYDDQNNYVGNSLEWADITAKLESARKAASLFSMVETAETNFMIANMDRVITYCNPAVIKMLNKFTSKLRAKFKNFDPNNLVGVCVDEFHENPTHQKSILSNKANLPYKTEINVGGLEFGLNAMALLDEKGNQFGVAIEWQDLNDRAIYRDEVKGIINACNNGDLKYRGDVTKVADSFKPMLSGINEIIGAIVAPIGEVIEKLGSIAKGDLTAYVSGDYKGDHEKMKKGMNDTLNGLNELLLSVKKSAENVSAGAMEISSSSQSLSQAATEQAASLEEITSSVSELNSQTKQNAENASQANQLSESARNSAQDGGKLMSEMVSAMHEIEESSKNISKIIKVIDEIAFQTNLLALNAAVEAARAGAHGKGFAVVAEEVRNLAARSANAAKETTELIEGSAKKVNTGTNIAQRTSTSLNEIVAQVSKVNDLISEIASASQEQAQGLTQINSGLEQLEKVTQQNTAVAEESASASVELKSQGNKLLGDLGKFNLKQPDIGLSSLPAGISPDMLAAIKRLLSQQQSGSSVATKSAIPEKVREMPDRRAKGNSINPDDIIPMDDIDNLGRFK